MRLWWPLMAKFELTASLSGHDSGRRPLLFNCFLKITWASELASDNDITAAGGEEITELDALHFAPLPIQFGPLPSIWIPPDPARPTQSNLRGAVFVRRQSGQVPGGAAATWY